MDQAIAKLRETGSIYEKDGATWLRTTEFGDDKDRVVIKSDGQPAYIAADLAYYLDKRQRGFDLCIYMLGADHHGYIARLKAAAAALGDDPDTVEVLIGQMVNLVRDGQPVRMSKRAGTVITLDDLVEAIGVDAARYALTRSSVDTPIDIDLQLWSSASSENPVYYVQYAHARLSALARNAAELGLTPDTAHLGLLTHDKEGTLIRNLGEFARVLESAASLREPHRVCRYLEDLAGDYHRFYDSCRVLPQGDEDARRSAPRPARAVRRHPPGDRQRSGHSRCVRTGAHVNAHPAGPRHAEEIHHGGTPPRPQTSADALGLAPNIWPHNLVRRDDGEVAIAGVTVTDLAAEYGTPLFVIDEDDFRGRCREIAAAFGGGRNVHYAAKAFLCSEIARWVDEEGLSLDVASGGELAVALHAGFPAERIAFHGNNKSVDELSAAVKAGVGHVVLDSMTEIDRLDTIAGDAGVMQDVLIRITVGVEAHTHEFIATAHEDQKFGLSLASGAAMDAVRRVFAADHLRLVGLHSHIGSQIFDVDGFELAAHRVIGLLRDVVAEFGVDKTAQIGTVDLGGGLGISYVPQDDPPPVQDLAAKLGAIVGNESAAVGLPAPRLVVEPGRAIAGPGTVTLYEVGTVKDVAISAGASRRYISVDGGMSDNIRTSLYGAEYEVRLVSRGSDAPPALARIVGKHCESGDIVVRDAWVPGDVHPGDLLAVAATGAYCYSMSSRYNLIGRPAVVAVRDGRARLILRRETVDDLLSLEVR